MHSHLTSSFTALEPANPGSTWKMAAANDGGFVALKRAAEDTEGRRHRERMPKT